MRRLAMGVGAFENPYLGAPSRYLEHILLNSRKILRGLWSRRIYSKNSKDFSKIHLEISKFDLRFSHFSRDSSTSEASKKFSRAQKYMFKVSRRCSWIRAFERTKSHGHTMHRSKKFADFRFLWKKKHSEIPFWISLFYLQKNQRLFWNGGWVRNKSR